MSEQTERLWERDYERWVDLVGYKVDGWFRAKFATHDRKDAEVAVEVLNALEAENRALQQRVAALTALFDSTDDPYIKRLKDAEAKAALADDARDYEAHLHPFSNEDNEWWDIWCEKYDALTSPDTGSEEG